MELRIDSNDYEETKKVKQSSVRYEILEVLRQVDYLENRYEQKRKAIENREKDLLWSGGIRVAVSLGIYLIGVAFSILSDPRFGWITVIACNIFALVVLVSALRIFLSWGTHKELLRAPLALVKNRLLKGQENISGGLYTLRQEEEDCMVLQRQLEKNKQSLCKFLEQTDINEEEGKSLLAEVLPNLTEDERYATYLYGEKV